MCPDDKDIAKLPISDTTLRKFDAETDNRTKEVLEFVRRFQIKPGNTPIEAMRIYLKYKHSKSYGSKPLNFKNFFMKFSKFFTKKRRKNGIVYFLNQDPFDLTLDGYWDYRKKLRNEKEKQQEKKEN
jgi:hypothetical protein